MRDQVAENKWFVSRGGDRYGPYPTDVLVDWIAAGRVAREAMVSNGGPWISAGDFLMQQTKAAVEALEARFA